MDQVLTIDNWWDGPLQGLATCGGKPCIYRRIFSQELDDYTGCYQLTAVDEADAAAIMADWARWCRWMEDCPQSADRALAWRYTQESMDLERMADEAPADRKFCRYAVFSGTFENFCTPIENYFVQWSERPPPIP